MNDVKVGEGHKRTLGMIFSADVGIDLGTPAVEASGPEERSRFTGYIPKATVEVHAPTPVADISVPGAAAPLPPVPD